MCNITKDDTEEVEKHSAELAKKLVEEECRTKKKGTTPESSQQPQTMKSTVSFLREHGGLSRHMSRQNSAVPDSGGPEGQNPGGKASVRLRSLGLHLLRLQHLLPHRRTRDLPLLKQFIQKPGRVAEAEKPGFRPGRLGSGCSPWKRRKSESSPPKRAPSPRDR